MGLVIGNEDDAHAPSGVGRQQAAELVPRKLAVVNVDEGFVAGAAVINHAAKHVTSRSPLIAPLEVLDMRSARWNLDRHVLVREAESLRRLDVLVEAIEDLLIRHLLDRRPEPEVRRPESRLDVLDDGFVVLTRDPNLVKRRDVWTFETHGAPPAAPLLPRAPEGDGSFLRRPAQGRPLTPPGACRRQRAGRAYLKFAGPIGSTKVPGVREAMTGTSEAFLALRGPKGQR